VVNDQSASQDSLPSRTPYLPNLVARKAASEANLQRAREARRRGGLANATDAACGKAESSSSPHRYIQFFETHVALRDVFAPEFSLDQERVEDYSRRAEFCPRQNLEESVRPFDDLSISSIF